MTQCIHDLAGVCTGPGPCVTTPLGTGNNWLKKVGGLPLYIRAIANRLRADGMDESRAISTAVATVKRWAAGGGNVTAPTRARAAKAVAEWEAKKAASHALTADSADTIDLANGGGLVYHWKHGWIPLDHVAALSKAHGSHTGAVHVMRKHGITPPAEHHAAKVSVRQASYRGESGHLITGKDAHGRRVQVFAGDRKSAGQAVANIRAGRPAFGDHPKTDGAGAAKLVQSDVHGDGRTDAYRLPSGHVVGVDRSTGRVHNLFKTDASGRDALDANPHLFEKRSVGTSLAHNDHYVLKGHQPPAPAEKPVVDHGALASRLSMEDLRVAQLRGTMTAQQVRDYVQETARIAARNRDARPPAEVKKPAAPALPAGIHIEHTGDGTLVHGTTRAEAPILKQHGFRWSSNLGAWYLPRNQHESTRRVKADAAHRDLVAAGHNATITKDAGSTVSAAERETQQRERSAVRAERLTERAAKHEAEANRRHEAARAIMDRIPMGQPILIGHHSERGHRADLKRIDQNMSKMVEAGAASRDATRRAEAAKRNAEHADTPLLRQRRIDRNAAEIRKIDKSLAQHEIAVKKPEAAARFGIHPSSDAHLEQLRAERARLADQVAHDKAQIEASGHKAITAADLQPGDVIHYRGRPHIVKKVNKTTVNVPTPYSWDDKVPINQITKHVRTESTAAIEKILEDPNASAPMKTAAREILAARAKKAARKGAALTAAPTGTVDLAFTEQLHPRGKKGTAQGGKFVAKNSSGSGSPSADTRDFQRRTGLKQTGRYDAATAAKVNALTNPHTGGGGSGGGKSKRGKHSSKGKHAAGGSGSMTSKQAAAARRVNAVRTAVAVNKLTPAQRELFRAKHPKPPAGYRWNAAGLLVAVATNPQARRVRAILARP